MPRGRKEKPMPRRTRTVGDSPYWTTAELCDRYRISRRTLRRWTEQRGYPDHRRNGKTECYPKQQCSDWEKKHMPELHTEPEMSEDDKAWHRLYLRRQLDKEEAASHPPPPPKPGRTQRARA